jgi:hypothetical protein
MCLRNNNKFWKSWRKFWKALWQEILLASLLFKTLVYPGYYVSIYCMDITKREAGEWEGEPEKVNKVLWQGGKIVIASSGESGRTGLWHQVNLLEVSFDWQLRFWRSWERK